MTDRDGQEVSVRRARPDDVEELSALTLANRAYLAPTDSSHNDDYFTPAGIREHLDRALADPGGHPAVIVLGDRLAGRINLHHIVRGPLQSATVGYWVGEEFAGRRVATRALGLMVGTAFGELGLHRLEAGTLLDNVGSQNVLRANGFEEIGVARKLLLVNGDWRDHLLFQRIADPP